MYLSENQYEYENWKKEKNIGGGHQQRVVWGEVDPRYDPLEGRIFMVHYFRIDIEGTQTHCGYTLHRR